jgi:NAD(P)-dependent dehydrogenase (short-subunit alcohol dehydrogenase family)
MHAAYQLIRLAVPELIPRGEGLAVFFGSGAAVSHLPGIGAYGAAKAAAEHLARQLAAEAPRITSFVFRPDVTETRMQQQAREAMGGAAAILHRAFRGYRERGELSTPEDQARSLVALLMNNPWRGPGKIVG